MRSWQWSGLCVSLSTIAALAFSSTPVFACSLSADYKGPETNFELVQQADTILVGTLVKSLGKDDYDRKILVKPTLLLKGNNLPKAVYISGYSSDRTVKLPDKEIQVHAKNSEPYDLWRPHPEVWLGGCSRHTFNQHMQLVLFFKGTGEKLEWFNPAFSRSAEDVTDHNGLWVRAVRAYVRIGKLRFADQMPALSKEINSLKTINLTDTERNLLADEFERQIAGCPPISNFEFGSEFAYKSAKCSNPKWADNIVDAAYFYEPPAVEIITNDRKPFNRVALWVLALSLMSVLALVAVVKIMRNRKADI